MNKLEIRRNDLDQVVSCVSYDEDESISDYVKIELPQNVLDKLFIDLVDGQDKNKYIEYKESIVGNNIKFTFYDIDIDLTDRLRIKSSNFKKRRIEEKDMIKNSKIVNEDNIQPIKVNNTKVNKPNDIVISQKPKISRINKFKRTAVKASVSLLALLTVYGMVYMGQVQSKNTPVKDASEIVYIDPSVNILHMHNENELRPNKYFNKEHNESNENKDNDVENNDIENNQVYEEVVPTDNNPVTLENNFVQEDIQIDQDISLLADDYSSGKKAYIAKAYYYDTICDIAKTYGVDPTLALAICTQERGIHSDITESDGGIGLFQIQVEGSWNWNGQKLTAYNFDTNSYETVVVTTEDASDVFKNIQFGCMILQQSLSVCNYNIAQGITYYNCGGFLDNPVLSECSKATGVSIKDIRNNPNDLSWLEYRQYLKCGDPHYLENVFKYVPDGTVMTFTKPDGATINVRYNNLAISKDEGRTK